MLYLPHAPHDVVGRVASRSTRGGLVAALPLATARSGVGVRGRTPHHSRCSSRRLRGQAVLGCVPHSPPLSTPAPSRPAGREPTALRARRIVWARPRGSPVAHTDSSHYVMQHRFRLVAERSSAPRGYPLSSLSLRRLPALRPRPAYGICPRGNPRPRRGEAVVLVLPTGEKHIL